MNFIARLHRFLLEIEEDLGETGLFFGQCEDGFIDSLQTKRSLDALAARIRDMKLHASFGAGTIDGGVGGGFDLELLGGLHEDEAMIDDWLSVPAKKIGVNIQRSSHLGRGVEDKFGLTVLEVQIAREDGLTILDDIHVCGAVSTGRKDFELNAVTGLEDGPVGVEKNLV